MRSRTSRARLAVSAVATAGLCLTATAGLATPSQADPGSCDTAYPVDQLTTDQAVTGLTVTQGTAPSSFNGTIIGVLHDGVEPDVDMVMAKLSSTEIDDNGIWEGMSGSPVYDQATGELIGAVAYTLAWGKTGVAGITPWSDMQTYAGQAAPEKVDVPASAARAIARHTSVTASQASQGFAEVGTPQLVAGLPQRVLDRVQQNPRTRPYLPKGVSAAGRTSSGAVDVSDMIAGGNLVATLSTGDITQAGLGTITSVCDDRVVGFGHPMSFTGRSSYGLAGADALYIQGDPQGASFKVANIGDLLGTIDQDRMTGISGPLGETPPSFPITSALTYTPDEGAGSSRTGSSEVQDPDSAAVTGYYELIANHQRVMDSFQPGSEEQSWTVDGEHDGTPFHFTGGNLYRSTYDIADTSSWDLPDLLYLLTSIHGVSIDSVHVHSDVSDDTALLKTSGLQQRRHGSWHDLGKGRPAVVKAGHALTLRMVFAGGRTGKKFSLDIPKKAAGMRGSLDLSPAEGYPFERSYPSRFAGVAKLVANAQRNDQSQVALYAFDGGHSMQLHTMSPRQGTVIEGHARAQVRIS